MSTGSAKLALARTVALTIPEGGVARATPASAAETAPIVRKIANRFLVIYVETDSTIDADGGPASRWWVYLNDNLFDTLPRAWQGIRNRNGAWHRPDVDHVKGSSHVVHPHGTGRIRGIRKNLQGLRRCAIAR